MGSTNAVSSWCAAFLLETTEGVQEVRGGSGGDSPAGIQIALETFLKKFLSLILIPLWCFLFLALNLVVDRLSNLLATYEDKVWHWSKNGECLLSWRSDFPGCRIGYTRGQCGEEALHSVVLGQEPLGIPRNSARAYKAVCYSCCHTSSLFCVFGGFAWRFFLPDIAWSLGILFLHVEEAQVNWEKLQHGLRRMRPVEAFQQVTGDSRAMREEWWTSAGPCEVKFWMSSLPVVLVVFLLVKTSAIGAFNHVCLKLECCCSGRSFSHYWWFCLSCQNLTAIFPLIVCLRGTGRSAVCIHDVGKACVSVKWIEILLLSSLL